MPTGHYHLMSANMSRLCDGGNTVTLVPQGLFTDGTMSVEHEGNFTLVHYACVDRVMVDGDVMEVVALVCEEDLHVTIPKCCHEGEIFSHDELECVSSRVSKFSTAELYGETEVMCKIVSSQRNNMLIHLRFWFMQSQDILKVISPEKYQTAVVCPYLTMRKWKNS